MKLSVYFIYQFRNYQKQNWPVCELGTLLLFNRFWFEYLITDPKSYRPFEKRDPRARYSKAPVTFRACNQIEIKRIRAQVLAGKLLQFVSLTDGFILLDAKLLKTGVKKEILGSEIWRAGTPPPIIPRSTPPPPLGFQYNPVDHACELPTNLPPCTWHSYLPGYFSLKLFRSFIRF